MSVPAREETLLRYTNLLDLALAQLQAIDSHDQKKLNQIIEQKWSIIRSLSGTKELLKSEPSLSSMIKQIQQADQLAQDKLAERMTDVRKRLCQVKKQGAAGLAYAHTGRKKHPILGFQLDDNTPRYFDQQS
jgi:hypothetical protein